MEVLESDIFSTSGIIFSSFSSKVKSTRASEGASDVLTSGATSIVESRVRSEVSSSKISKSS